MAWTVGGVALMLAVAAWAWMTQPLFVAGGAVVDGPAPDPERLARRVNDLVRRFHPRDSGHPENLRRAARFISDELGRTGAVVSEQSFEAAGATYANVIAAIGPDTPDVVVVGAHYDVAGEMPGADDNASGVAGLARARGPAHRGEPFEPRRARRLRPGGGAVLRHRSRWGARSTPVRSRPPVGGFEGCCASR